jgi:Tfp pilus assembly protein PilO
MMTTPSPHSRSLEDRISNLEAENRELQRLASQVRFVAAMLAVALILYAAWHTLLAGPIRASEKMTDREKRGPPPRHYLSERTRPGKAG